MADLIESKNITKIYRSRSLAGSKHGFKAVDEVSVNIKKQSIFGLVGESGCGKTTFGRALMYLDPPTSGSVIFDDVPLGSLKPKELRRFRNRMQIVFQDPNSALDPKMSIYNSLSEGMVNLKIPKEQRDRKVNDLINLVGIGKAYLRRFPHELSGGQKQRIVIARALSMDPDFLVLDEPTSNLDVSIQAQIINLLIDLKNEFELTYLFISHDLNLVSYMCDEIAVMFKGRIVEQAETELLISEPSHPYTQKLFSSIPGGAQRIGVKSLNIGELGEKTIREPQKEEKSQAGCSYYSQCPMGDAECSLSAPFLRELSRGHVVSCHKIRTGK
ncbi:MAG TPA: ATP-binding cassette domain-containing protein [Rectinema sp.]|mgnify:FL=1|nr:ATP-binding cassette domain-containing protein [Rectinema sp.]HOO01800.1 ATP-binding cassette domain-containing protein [Rectinema sp.]HOR90926.1 ATP-binding cassette domain-containing protein [Rectinema sp.]